MITCSDTLPVFVSAFLVATSFDTHAYRQVRTDSPLRALTTAKRACYQ
jgi:hypothetical protein